SSLAARKTRMAISERLATRSLLIFKGRVRRLALRQARQTSRKFVQRKSNAAMHPRNRAGKPAGPRSRGCRDAGARPSRPGGNGKARHVAMPGPVQPVSGAGLLRQIIVRAVLPLVEDVAGQGDVALFVELGFA